MKKLKVADEFGKLTFFCIFVSAFRKINLKRGHKSPLSVVTT